MQTGRSQRRRWLAATVAAVTLGAGTSWLLIKGTRGAEIATVLALSVAVLGLLVMALRGATDGTPSTAPPPKIDIFQREASVHRRWLRDGALAGVAGLAGIVVVVVLITVARSRPSAAHGPTSSPNSSGTLPSHLHEVALPKAGSAPLDIAAATDGTAWFTELENNKIGHLTADGTIQEFDKTNAGDRLLHPFAIAAGPAKDAWFTEGVPADESRPSGNRIGHITADGVITTYPIPTANAGAVGITVRPDGVVWFTEQRAGQIGRLNLDHSIDEFPVGGTSGGSSWPNQITSGPDGNLWFTEFSANKIAEMTPDGKPGKEYDISHGGPGPVDIIARGHELWFTVINGKKIGRLDPAGADVQWIDVPTTGELGPANLAEDRDRAGVWLTELSDAAITYLSDAQPAKTDTGHSLPGGSQPIGISVGPDGTVWFTEQLGNRIGWISTS